MSNKPDAVSQLSVANAPKMNIHVNEIGVLMCVYRVTLQKEREKLETH
jgi:hypothetical protein